jgi:hypothetical protein
MDGMKLIDAKDVVVKKKSSKTEKSSKIEIKKISKHPIEIITDSPIKIIADNDKQNVEESSVKNETKSSDAHSDKLPQDTMSRVIRAIKLKQDIYYGPKNMHKNKFVRMYKKLGLKWIERVIIDDVTVDGWFNSDKSQYIIKLLEDGDFKRFKFYGCDDIYDYFIDLGAVTFDYTKENSLSSNYQNDNIANTDIGKVGKSNTNRFNDICNTGFIGADLWSGFRTKQLLRNVHDNWGVIWK